MGTSYGPVYVSVSARSQCSIETAEQIGLVFWHVSFFELSTLCFEEIQVPSKIRVHPSGTLLQTLDLDNFATAYRSLKRVIDLARERWTHRA